MPTKIWSQGPSAENTSNPLTWESEQLGFVWTRQVGGVQDGVENVMAICGEKRIQIVPTRGMGIWQAEHAGIRFGWDSPVRGPVHPRFVPIPDPNGLGWLEGFDEMLARCGLASNGAPEFDERGRLVCPLHGRIANLPAHEVSIEIDESAGQIAVHGVVLESRFHFHRLQLETTITLKTDSDEIEIADRVTNLSDRPSQTQMLYHNNFGPPILGKDSRFFAPVKRLAPRDQQAARGIDSWDRYGPPDTAYQEQVYFMELAADQDGRSLALLTNANQSCGVSIDYDTSALPCFTLWKNTVGLADGYVTGLEPGTNFPNIRSFEANHDRVVSLEPGQSVGYSLRIGMLVRESSVTQAMDRIERLQPDSVVTARQPLAEWSANS